MPEQILLLDFHATDPNPLFHTGEDRHRHRHQGAWSETWCQQGRNEHGRPFAAISIKSMLDAS